MAQGLGGNMPLLALMGSYTGYSNRNGACLQHSGLWTTACGMCVGMGEPPSSRAVHTTTTPAYSFTCTPSHRVPPAKAQLNIEVCQAQLELSQDTYDMSLWHAQGHICGGARRLPVQSTSKCQCTPNVHAQPLTQPEQNQMGFAQQS